MSMTLHAHTRRTPVRKTPARLAGGAVLTLWLAGCASFSPDGGLGAVEKVAAERLEPRRSWSGPGSPRT
jgi:hypothetical protein